MINISTSPIYMRISWKKERKKEKKIFRDLINYTIYARHIHTHTQSLIAYSFYSATTSVDFVVIIATNSFSLSTIQPFKIQQINLYAKVLQQICILATVFLFFYFACSYSIFLNEFFNCLKSPHQPLTLFESIHLMYIYRHTAVLHSCWLFTYNFLFLVDILCFRVLFECWMRGYK